MKLHHLTLLLGLMLSPAHAAEEINFPATKLGSALRALMQEKASGAEKDCKADPNNPTTSHIQTYQPQPCDYEYCFSVIEGWFKEDWVRVPKDDKGRHVNGLICELILVFSRKSFLDEPLENSLDIALRGYELLRDHSLQKTHRKEARVRIGLIERYFADLDDVWGDYRSMEQDLLEVEWESKKQKDEERLRAYLEGKAKKDKA